MFNDFGGPICNTNAFFNDFGCSIYKTSAFLNICERKHGKTNALGGWGSFEASNFIAVWWAKRMCTTIFIMVWWA